MGLQHLNIKSVYRLRSKFLENQATNKIPFLKVELSCIEDRKQVFSIQNLIKLK